MGRRLQYLTEGSWVPGRTNWLVLVLQVLLTVQTAARGIDYVQPRPPLPMPPQLSIIEAALPLPIWGCGLLALAGLVFGGLFAGWVWPIITGHLCIAGLYGAFSYGVLTEVPMRSQAYALLGLTLLTPGLVLGVSRWRSWRWVRIILAIIMVIAGGWLTGSGLGYDFRTGTALFIAGLCHAALAVGIAFLAYRRPPVQIR